MPDPHEPPPPSPEAVSAAEGSLLKTILLSGVALALAVAAFIPGAAAVLGANEYSDLNSIKLRELSRRSTIYDTAGNTMDVLGTENREDAKLEEVPKILQNAVIAVEDKTFWSNDGVDVNGLMRAAAKNLTSGEVQGGSTITQQLVKNRILSPKRNLSRKVREIVLAMRVDSKYSKKEILEQYLNTVYFGQGSYGVKAAVERFFIKFGAYGLYPTKLEEVSVGQAALLAGLIANPEGNNPFVYPERARERRAFALERMVDQEYITQEQADAANKEPLPAIKPQSELRPRSSWTEEIQDRLFTDPMFAALGKTEKERRDKVLSGGLKIQSTKDPKIQDAAQKAIDEILPEKPGFTGALVAMDPRNGHVKAMVAGPGFEASQYNIATSYPGRQAGSTWKAITLAAALEKGFSPNDTVSGSSPCEFDGLGRTQNAEGGGGTMTIRAATANSVNCAFARIELATGFDPVIKTAHALGITQTTLTPILTLTLGTIESTPLEMATVASTIANNGIHYDPLFVSKITDADGKVIFDSKAISGKAVIKPETAACEIDLLRGVITGGTGTAAQLADRPVFGKTGTTDNKTDANFLGATPQLAAFVWHGNAKAAIPGAGFGGEIPARIFKRFMDAALAGQEVFPFPDPGPVCARPGRYVDEKGRSNTVRSTGRGTVTTVPPSVAPGKGPAVTIPRPPPPPPTTSPPTTSPPQEGSSGDAEPNV
jgi:membrane peptidoglycan carboxypeptidase